AQRPRPHVRQRSAWRRNALLLHSLLDRKRLQCALSRVLHSSNLMLFLEAAWPERPYETSVDAVHRLFIVSNQADRAPVFIDHQPTARCASWDAAPLAGENLSHGTRITRPCG